MVIYVINDVIESGAYEKTITRWVLDLLVRNNDNELIKWPEAEGK